MSFPSTEPRIADSDNNLLFKICQELSNQNGGAHPPQLGDSDNNLLFKIAQLVILDGTGDAACTAALATCNSLTTSQAAQIAALNAQIAANPQNMGFQWTPTSSKLGENFLSSMSVLTGITSINYTGTTASLGVSITSTGLLSILLSNLTSSPAAISIQSNASLTSISAPVLSTPLDTSAAAIIIFGNANLTSVSLPALSVTSGGADFRSNVKMVSWSLPALVTVGGFNRNLQFSTSTLLQSISLPQLVTISGGFFATTCPALTTISFPNYLPTNARSISVTGCALTQATVDHILARAVANAAYVSGTINLSGGTSSAPGVQGLLDKAALILRGCTVTTN